tara:strand:- start:146 stop:487 length:342 start_codon:yes stop_codon:yes gene_type:complete
MDNTTVATHDMNDASWVIVPIVLSALIYMSITLFVWPYARPMFSLWVLLFCLFFPPAFFFLATYVLILFFFGTLTTPEQPVVVVQRASNAPVVVERQGRVRVAGVVISRSSHV